jgi:hypothetical protein
MRAKIEEHGVGCIGATGTGDKTVTSPVSFVAGPESCDDAFCTEPKQKVSLEQSISKYFFLLQITTRSCF